MFRLTTTHDGDVYLLETHDNVDGTKNTWPLDTDDLSQLYTDAVAAVDEINRLTDAEIDLYDERVVDTTLAEEIAHEVSEALSDGRDLSDSEASQTVIDTVIDRFERVEEQIEQVKEMEENGTARISEAEIEEADGAETEPFQVLEETVFETEDGTPGIDARVQNADERPLKGDDVRKAREARENGNGAVFDENGMLTTKKSAIEWAFEHVDDDDYTVRPNEQNSYVASKRRVYPLLLALSETDRDWVYAKWLRSTSEQGTGLQSTLYSLAMVGLVDREKMRIGNNKLQYAYHITEAGEEYLRRLEEDDAVPDEDGWVISV